MGRSILSLLPEDFVPPWLVGAEEASEPSNDRLRLEDRGEIVMWFGLDVLGCGVLNCFWITMGRVGGWAFSGMASTSEVEEVCKVPLAVVVRSGSGLAERSRWCCCFTSACAEPSLVGRLS